MLRPGEGEVRVTPRYLASEEGGMTWPFTVIDRGGMFYNELYTSDNRMWTQILLELSHFHVSVQSGS